ncbi:hypothetical protein EJB05_08800, partial [Eragrostis curvula]
MAAHNYQARPTYPSLKSIPLCAQHARQANPPTRARVAAITPASQALPHSADTNLSFSPAQAQCLSSVSPSRSLPEPLLLPRFSRREDSLGRGLVPSSRSCSGKLITTSGTILSTIVLFGAQKVKYFQQYGFAFIKRKIRILLGLPCFPEQPPPAPKQPPCLYFSLKTKPSKYP